MNPFYFSLLISLCACRSRTIQTNEVSVADVEPSVEPGEELPEDGSSEQENEGSSSGDSSNNGADESDEPTDEPSDSSEGPSEESSGESDAISDVPGCDFGVICYSFVGAGFAGFEEDACNQINDYYQSQDPNTPWGQYVEAGCPPASFGYCHIMDTPDYYVYFYDPYAPSDAEYTCEEGGGSWVSL